MSSVNFIFCLHNHQPVDNFDKVFQRAVEESYEPFLDVLERHPGIRMAAHYSGPLLEWMEERRPRFFDRLSRLVEAGRMELMGGGFYEPVFAMLPERDAVGQIEMTREYLRERFRADAGGLWVPERVWEPSMASTFARAGARYTVLDDFHFKAAGLRDEDLDGWFWTEDQGRLFRVFPLREALRYSIPYQDPQVTIDFLLARGSPAGDRVVVYADDGEKFGLWPGTKAHVFEGGWLDRFLGAMERASDRIRMVTFQEAIDRIEPRGRVYLPNCSYREMGEWAMLPGGRPDYDEAQRRLEFARHMAPGGIWRNFRVKYPEANLMYGRMLDVSRRLESSSSPKKGQARRELYRGQCNCGYWHGIFGGLYLNHLRASVYRHLIAAEALLEEPGHRGVETLDLDLDGREDLRIFNGRLNLFVTPALGGRMVELDYRPRAVNLTATLARRPEPYHAGVKDAPVAAPGETRSIHHLHASKEPNLDRLLVFDPHPRAALVDRFFAVEGEPEESADVGDFATGPYRIERRPGGGTPGVILRREGRAGGIGIDLEKSVALDPSEAEFRVEYRVTARGRFAGRFGVGLDLALLDPESAVRADGRDAGALSDDRRIEGARSVVVRDRWYGLEVELRAEAGAAWRLRPVYAVSQSESGFEKSYQSTLLLPTWSIELEAGRSWTTALVFRIGEGKG